MGMEKEQNVVLDLKIIGPYSKTKVAEKIILAANHAVNIDARLHSWQWGITWDNIKKKFRSSYIENHFNYGTILAAVILFSNYTAEESKEKTKVAAEILGIEHEWIQGFLNGIDGRYNSKVGEIAQRRSLKGQQCRDGIEIGNLLRTGYLAEDVIRTTFQPYTKENYDTHNWLDIEENKTLLSMGVVQKVKILKCKDCNMFGSAFVDRYYKKDTFYISKSLVGNKYYRSDDIFNCNCNEVIIKNILE